MYSRANTQQPKTNQQTPAISCSPGIKNSSASGNAKTTKQANFRVSRPMSGSNLLARLRCSSEPDGPPRCVSTAFASRPLNGAASKLVTRTKLTDTAARPRAANTNQMSQRTHSHVSGSHPSKRVSIRLPKYISPTANNAVLTASGTNTNLRIRCSVSKHSPRNGYKAPTNAPTPMSLVSPPCCVHGRLTGAAACQPDFRYSAITVG